MPTPLAALALLAVAVQPDATVEFIAPGDRYHADINAHGDILARHLVGAGSVYELWRYTDDAGVRTIDVPGADEFASLSLNDNADFTLLADPVADPVAWRHLSGQGLEPIEIPGPYYSVNPSGLNSDATIAGYASGNPTLPFTLDAAGNLTDLQAIDPAFILHTADAINDAGQVVGAHGQSVADTRAYRYTPGQGFEDPGTLGGDTAVVHGINDRGDAFGWSEDAAGNQRPALYPAEGGVVRIAEGLALHLAIQDINDLGWLAVNDYSADRAMLWTEDTGLIDLNDLLPDSMSDTHLEQALALNDAGQVVGYGVIEGEAGIYRMTIDQVPSPRAGALLVVGLAHRRRRAAAPRP